MGYAQDTEVPIGRSQDEIRNTLTKYKATGFMFGETMNQSIIAFEMNQRRIKFVITRAQIGVSRTKNNQTMTQKQVDKENRRLWRCILLAIKSKLECVASGISTFEQEFLAHIVLPNGETVGQVMIPQIEASYKNQSMPPLLGHGG
jgi:hypothetical protein